MYNAILDGNVLEVYDTLDVAIKGILEDWLESSNGVVITIHNVEKDVVITMVQPRLKPNVAIVCDENGKVEMYYVRYILDNNGKYVSTMVSLYELPKHSNASDGKPS